MKLLKEICLLQIVNDFEGYFTAYCKIEDASLKLPFEFLRRVYSFEIITELDQLGTFKPQYVKFLINRHLKILFTDWLKSCTWAFIRKKFEEVGPSLEQVFCLGKKMPWKKVVRYLPNLKQVSCSHGCDDFLCAISRYCPSVEVIDLNFSKISNYGIEQLCHKENGKTPCPLLKELLIKGTDVDNVGIKNVLLNLHSLEKIDHEKLPEVLYDLHTKNFFVDKIKPCNLTQLNLMHVEFRWILHDVLKTCILVCPNLKSLSCPVLKPDNLKLLSEGPELEKLHLHNFNDSHLAIDYFLKLKGSKLEFLQLCNFSVSVNILSQSCPCLSSLHMKTVNFLADSTNNDFVAVFHNLKKISFINSILVETDTVKSIENILMASQNLRMLVFRNCEVLSKMSAIIKKSCEQCKIEVIDFSLSSVNPKFIETILLTCSSLQYLNVHGCTFLHEFSTVEVNSLKEIAQLLPNKPKILHNVKPSSVNVYEDSASECGISDSEDDDENFEILEEFDDDYIDDDDYMDEDADEYSDGFDEEEEEIADYDAMEQ